MIGEERKQPRSFGKPLLIALVIQGIPFGLAFFIPNDFAYTRATIGSAVPLTNFLTGLTLASVTSGAVMGYPLVRNFQQLGFGLIPPFALAILGALFYRSNVGLYTWGLIALTQAPIAILGAAFGAFMWRHNNGQSGRWPVRKS